MPGHKPSVFRFADLEVREREFSLTKGGEIAQVEPKAFRVLLFLLHNPQKLITKAELLDAMWGETAVSENSLTRSIAVLRHLLGDDPHQPHTSRLCRRSGTGSYVPSRKTHMVAWRQQTRLVCQRTGGERHGSCGRGSASQGGRAGKLDDPAKLAGYGGRCCRGCSHRSNLVRAPTIGPTPNYRIYPDHPRQSPDDAGWDRWRPALFQ